MTAVEDSIHTHITHFALRIELSFGHCSGG